MANQFLALSLFIMLLSFFIVLSSLSTFEETKTRSIMDSISISFSTRDTREEDLAPNIEAASTESFQSGSTLDRIDRLFKSEISNVKVTKNRFGTVMYIRVPVREFEFSLMQEGPVESAESQALQGIGGAFLPMLVSLLESTDAVPYRMDMVLNISENPASLMNETPKEARGYLDQVSSYAARLESAGLPRKLVTAGLGDGQAGSIDLYFRRYAPFNPVSRNP